ncbi:MAG TPA: CDP-diacylglycerol diphosphatase [Stellaceae bacterium]|nr:CDP-diacylglycerol diphosphatase [Stellaceae bacterium]
MTTAGLLFVFGGGPLPAQPTSISPQPAPLAVSAAACVVAPRPNALWSLARCCATDLKSNPGCRYYDKADEFIILKDNSPLKPVSYMIIPTVKITGIEDRRIFAPPFVDFWAYGWRQAQTLIGKPAADMALAINSVTGRTQNQLHIHISCVKPEVARALAAAGAKIGSDPATAAQLALGPKQHTYRIVKVTTLTGADSPYNLAAALSGARVDMAAQSIAVVGSTTPGAYYVLDTEARGANRGAAEELLDQYCTG